MSKAPRLPQKTRLFIFYCISNHENFIPKQLDNALTDSTKTSETSRRLLEDKAPVNDFEKQFPVPKKILLQVKQVTASFRCYNNSDVIANPDHNKFSSFLIQLWWQFFQIFVHGDVVHGKTWEILTLKNCFNPP